ncbi:hypothetical protein AB1L16_05065 [Peribacillus frigoritolerans]
MRSMHKAIEEVEINMAYRWFLGFGFHYKVPHCGNAHPLGIFSDEELPHK